jgi:hypothetical protein
LRFTAINNHQQSYSLQFSFNFQRDTLRDAENAPGRGRNHVLVRVLRVRS